MNFDDDDLDLEGGYTPTIARGSRSATMKKLTRKNQAKPQPKPENKSKNDDFDLLDDLLGPQPPKKTSVEKSKASNTYGGGLDSVDSFFDEPSPKKAPSKMLKPTTTKTLAEKQQPLLILDDPIIEEQPKLITQPEFKSWRPSSSINPPKQKKVADQDVNMSVSPSLRNMKPPLRRRQSKDSNKSKQMETPLVLKDTVENNELSLGLTVTDEMQSKKSFSLFKDKDDDRSPVKKKVSIDKKPGELKLTLDDNPPHDFSKQFKQKSSLQIQDSIMIDDEPSYAPKAPNKSSINNNNNKYLLPPTLPKQQKASLKSYKGEKTNNLQMDKASVSQQSAEGFQKKQIDSIIRNYQSHINSLQQNLSQQIKNNKETRLMLMKEADQMIQNERSRLNKLHEEQIDRIKQMANWQKNKIEENYRLQIERLKKQLQFTDKNHSNNSQANNFVSNFDIQRKQIKYLEQKVKMEKRGLEDREKMLDRREFDLQQRQRQFLKKKKYEEDQLREQQKKIMKLQMDSKKQIIESKRKVENQKQSCASQIAQLEIENLRKKQRLQEKSLEIESQKLEMEKQRQEMRKLNRQYLMDIKQKQAEIRAKEQYLARAQSDLINKLKIIQARASKINAEQSHTGINITHKQNNWQTSNLQLKRPLSANTKNQQKKLAETQNRFCNISHNIRQNMKPATKQTFDLDKYLMNMAKYTRTNYHV